MQSTPTPDEPRRHPVAALVVAIISATAGIGIAWATAVRAGLPLAEIANGRLPPAPGLISLVIIGLIAAGVAAGILCLPVVLRERARRASIPQPQLSLAAFAIGPALLGFFFAMTSIVAAAGLESHALPYAVSFLLIAYLIRGALAAMAEWLLLAFIVWLLLLIAPAFLRDPVNHAALTCVLNVYRLLGVLG